MVPSKTNWLTWLKVAIFLLVMGGVTYQLVVVQKLSTIIDSWFALGTTRAVILLIIVAALMPLNWWLEAVKWRVALKKVQALSMRASFKAVISGVSLGLFTPNRIGEYGARILVLNRGNRISGIVASLVSSFAQIAVTIVVGCVALGAWVAMNSAANTGLYVLATGGLIVAGGLSIMYFHLPRVYRWASSQRFFRNRPKWLTPLHVLQRFDSKQSRAVLVWATLRYVVYTVQYLLLLWAVGLPITVIEGIQAISMMYLLQMVIPVPAIGELGVRALLAEPIFYQLVDPSGAVFVASATLWLVNLLLPGTVGAFLFVSLKPTKTE